MNLTANHFIRSLAIVSLACILVGVNPYSVGIVYGDSMKPVMSTCNIAVYDTNQNIEKGDIISAEYPDRGKSFTHKVTQIREKQVYTIGTNNSIGEITTKSNVKGVMVAHISINPICSSAGLSAQ